MTQAGPAQRRLSHTNVTFRIARPVEAGAVHELVERAYRGPEHAGRWDSESHLLKGPRSSLEEVAGLIADPGSRILVAEADGRLLASALVQGVGATACSPDAGDGSAYFGMFAVAPEQRGTGLGHRTLIAAEDLAQEVFGARAMVMTVISLRQELIAWYARRGYAPTGRRMPFPFSDTSGETRRDFDLVELLKPLQEGASADASGATPHA